MKAALDDAAFERLCRLLHDSAGLVFDGTRRDSLAYAVGARLADAGYPDVASYLDVVADPAGQVERQLLIDEVTIPETYFFRNPPQVRALRRQVLPELVAHAANARRLVVWSAGCSTGEEPYTVAMMLRDLVPASADWDVRIVATDVSQRALSAAQGARYGKRAVQFADAATVGRWFDAVDGEYVVRPEITELVQFRHHNLVTDPAPFGHGEVDLLLCRNVTIYFDRTTTRRLMGRFHEVLRTGGYLFLGHSETLWRVTDDFELAPTGDAFVYRRVDRTGSCRPVASNRDGTGGRSQPLPAPRGAEPSIAGERAADVERSQVEPTLGAVVAELRAGCYDEAVVLAGRLTAREPGLAEAWYLRGTALGNLGRDREALVDLRKAVYLDPGAGLAHFALAGALARLDERVAAAHSYRAAADTLGRRPGDAFASELGGRSVTELVELCRVLAESMTTTAPVGGVR
jgi:chemotaxis protein methyltransferase CheR